MLTLVNVPSTEAPTAKTLGMTFFDNPSLYIFLKRTFFCRYWPVTGFPKTTKSRPTSTRIPSIGIRERFSMRFMYATRRKAKSGFWRSRCFFETIVSRKHNLAFNCVPFTFRYESVWLKFKSAKIWKRKSEKYKRRLFFRSRASLQNYKMLILEEVVLDEYPMYRTLRKKLLRNSSYFTSAKEVKIIYLDKRKVISSPMKQTSKERPISPPKWRGMARKRRLMKTFPSTVLKQGL